MLDEVIIATRLRFEEQAFDMGFCDKVMNTLVADLLQGACRMVTDMDKLICLTTGGIHLRKDIREAVCNLGQSLTPGTNLNFERIKELLSEFKEDIYAAANENGIMASTGDCRGACKYNTGDRSEYRNYGW